MPVKQKRLAHSPCQSYNTPNPESRKTLPGRDWQTPAAPGQEAYLVQAFGSKMPGVRVSPLGPNNDNLNYIVQVGNVIGFIISIEMLVKTYKGREGPVLVCFIPHAIITFNISLQDHFIGRIVKPE